MNNIVFIRRFVFPIYGLPRAIWNEKYFERQKQLDSIIPEQATHPISVQRDNLRFCWIVRNSSLFLAHPTYWNKCMTSENIHPEVDFESSISPAKSESWNSPDLHCSEYYPHTIIVDKHSPSMHIREQESRLISVPCPERWFQILLNCEKLMSVSYTSNLWEQMRTTENT